MSEHPPAETLRDRFEREALPHLDAVLRFAIQVTGNRSRAEDLTQEVFLKAFRAYDSYEPGTHVKAWLLTILRNLQIDHHRKNGARPGTVPLDLVPDHELALDPHAPGAGSDMDPERFDQDVVRELSELGDEFRRALLLCDVEGLSYREIAEVMGCAVGTVRSRISRARAVLRERLRPHAGRLGLVADPAEVQG